ncbi:hypothetical protein ABTH13_20560, partial [Acinetobacter baumannii]
LAERATALVAELAADPALLVLEQGAVRRGREVLAVLRPGKGLLAPVLQLDPALESSPAPERRALKEALDGWLAARLAALEALA